MSRLQNPNNATALALQDRAYAALNDCFNEHQDEPLEIEIIPPALQSADVIVQKFGQHLGVPKPVLIAGYLKAKRQFFENIKNIENLSATRDATRVMLLFDPEHITAANLRKKWLVDLRAKTENCGQAALETAVGRETVFLNSILTSPLHRQSKSPTLWHHRAWLLESLLPQIFKNTSADWVLSYMTAELDAVFKSGEQHPKNYYAWQYARKLLTKLKDGCIESIVPVSTSEYNLFLQKTAITVKAWCCKHISDISGWTFLLFVLERLESISMRCEIVQQVVEFATKIHSEQESMWVFIRTVLAGTTLQQQREEVVRSLCEYNKSELMGVHPPNYKISETITWIEAYGRSI